MGTSTISQANRPLRATTPLGGDVLVPVALTGVEALSWPFLYTVDFVSQNAAIAAKDVLGKPFTLHFVLADGSLRHVHGIARRFTSLGLQRDIPHYRAEIVPTFWLLTLTGDCRTFEKKAPLDIVETVCKGAGVGDVTRNVADAPEVAPYHVQYNESDFAFVSRLLETVGVYYTFAHTADKDTLVLSDAFDSQIPAGQVPSLRVVAQRTGGDGGREEPNTVYDVTRDFGMHVQHLTMRDHDLLRAPLEQTSTSQSVGAHGARFTFLGDVPADPGEDMYDDILRREAEEAAVRDVVRGASNCPALQAGTRIKLVNGPFGSGGQEFLLQRVEYEMSVGDVRAESGLAARFECRFTAVPASWYYRAPFVTPRPSVRGTHTAIVVGTGNDGDVDVDEDGRVLLQFPWDRGDGKDGKSQHRVHVASVWAGQQWGFVQIPRLGQQVLVEYFEGDLERPVVTGRVYDSAHKPPYALPANKTQSGWKSRTLGGSASNFNEIRFDDKQGHEHIHVQAERELQVVVKGDETRSVGHDSRTTIEHYHDVVVTKGDQRLDVKEGNQWVLTKKGAQTLAIKEGTQVIETENGDQTLSAVGNQKFVVKQGDRTIEVQDGSNELTVKQGNVTLQAEQGEVWLYAQDKATFGSNAADVIVQADAGNVKIGAAQKIEIGVGSNAITIDQSGITLSGAMVKITATGQLELSGALVKVNGSGMLQLKAPMSQLNGDAVLMEKGGVTMIN